MGCWNGSCQATGLSIASGDRIVLMPLLPKYDGKIVPCLIPLRGEYDDGGSIRNIDRNSLVDSVEKQLIDMVFLHDEVIENEYGGDTVVPPPEDKRGIWMGHNYTRSLTKGEMPKNFEDLCNLIERQVCCGNTLQIMPTHPREWLPFGYCMVLEEIYDRMTSEMYPELVERYQNKLSKAIKARTELSSVKDLKDSEDSIYEKYRIIRDSSEAFHDLFKADFTCTGIRAININYDIAKMSDEEYGLTCKVINQYALFIEIMGALRKPFSNPASPGSQDENHSETIQFNKIVSQTVKNIKKQHKLRWGE